MGLISLCIIVRNAFWNFSHKDMMASKALNTQFTLMNKHAVDYLDWRNENGPKLHHHAILLFSFPSKYK